MSTTANPDSARNDGSEGMGAAESSSATKREATPPDAQGTWTTKRIVALAPGGPLQFDLKVSVGDRSLTEASEHITKAIADELMSGLEVPVTWETLLQQPLVQSGWLGNLVADEDQQSQLLDMYDTNRDDVVSVEELGPFLSRGLSRTDPLVITDIGNAPESDGGQSPWGRADANQDYSLDAEEAASIRQTLTRFDYNGDSIVSTQELDEAARMNMAPANMSGGSMLDTRSMLVAENVATDSEPEVATARRKLANRVLEHYTFLNEIPRDQWNGWTDEQWAAVDENKDSLLSREELESFVGMDCDTRIVLKFPELDAYRTGTEDEDRGLQIWSIDTASGKVLGGEPGESKVRSTQAQCIVHSVAADSFESAGQQQLRQQLAAALKNAQLRNFFETQLQLKENAFELLDPDADQILSDEEFDRAWRWLTSRQGTRLVARWMLARRPWFQLADTDGDGRLSSRELDSVETVFLDLDSNGDQIVTPNELPLTVRLDLIRSDDRIQPRNFGLPQPSEGPPVDSDWFAAMDTNRDGYVSQSEFLGEREDFLTLDDDKDGFLGRSEVY